MQIYKITPSINNNNTYSVYTPNKQSANIKFGCKPPTSNSKFFQGAKNLYNKIMVEPLARLVGKILDTDMAYKAVEASKRNDKLLNHLLTAGSILLSGLYMTRTLSNKDLDEKKRKTLAINQGLVFLASTFMFYFVDAKMKKGINNFTNRFEALNKTHLSKDELNKTSKGIEVASKMIVFDTINRFLAPVFITPIANQIGHKINENQ